jgi:DNA-binding NtrC family response regulator
LDLRALDGTGVACDRFVGTTARSVLVVDDDEEWRAVLAEVLVEEGFAVATARDGRDALRSMRDAMPELVITDVDMPLMDGCELLATIRELARDLPVVVMTGGERLDETTASHAFRVLRKPATTDTVLASVREALSRPRRWHDRKIGTMGRTVANVARRHAIVASLGAAAAAAILIATIRVASA